MPRADMDELLRLLIPLPPLPEQQRIAAILNEQMAAVERARAAAEARLEAAKGLRAAYIRSFLEGPSSVKWQRRRCQDIVDVRDGTHDTPRYVSRGVPLVTSKNLKPGYIDFTDALFISREDHEQIKKRSGVDVGDVLYAMIGTIGNPVRVTDTCEFSIKNVALFKLANSPITSEFFCYILQSRTIERQINAATQGGIQKFVSLGVLRNLEIPLPSLPEQQRITTALNCCGEAINRACEHTQAELDAINALPAALLRRAFSGAL